VKLAQRHPHLSQLARIRRALNLTQVEIANAAGLAQQYVSELERGLQPSDPNHVLRLAAVLGVEPEVLSAPRVTICSSTSGAVSVNSGD